MSQKRWLMLLIPLLLSACNLSFASVPTPTPPLIVPATSAPVIIVEPPVQTTPEVDSNSGAPCSPRVAWPIYIVQAGDTLADIADLSGSSIPELFTANCLDNPDAIFEGQVLHVPRAIADTGSFGAIPKVSGEPYQLLISPIANFADGGLAILQAGATVTLQWAQSTDEVPDKVEFDMAPTGTGMIPTIIGTATAANGWAIQWTVPAGMSANLSAVATMSDGTIRTTPLYLVYSGT